MSRILNVAVESELIENADELPLKCPSELFELFQLVYVPLCMEVFGASEETDLIARKIDKIKYGYLYDLMKKSRL